MDDDKKDAGSKVGEQWCLKGLEFVKKKRYDDAAKCFETGAALGDDQSLYNLAICYRDGLGEKKSAAECLRLLRQGMEESGNPHFEYQIAICYLDGVGVKKDTKMFLSYLARAAEANLPEAKYALGMYYLYGMYGLTRSVTDGMRLLSDAAVFGDEDAMAEFKRLDDEKIARREWDREGGDPLTDEQIKILGYGEYFLGLEYGTGQNVPKSRADSRDWLERSARNGNADAMMELCYVYDDPEDEGYSMEKIAHLARKSAEGGNAEAMGLLGWLYKYGRGVEQSDEKAREWIERGVAAGDENSKKYMKEFFGE